MDVDHAEIAVDALWSGMTRSRHHLPAIARGGRSVFTPLVLTLLLTPLPFGLGQDALGSTATPPAAPAATTDIDPRYEAVLRELVATPAGRAFLETLLLIEREYLYTTDTDTLLRGATAGLIEALDDPYSRYIDPEAAAARRAGETPDVLVDEVMLGDVGYVRIRDFDGENVGASVGGAVEAHLAGGALGFVLDLRGNTGGSILQGLQVLDRFLADGVLGFRRVRGVSVPIAYANPRSVTKPLVVLVDETTASTAEIVAGALQAYGRARLVGTVTAGKGIGQSAIELSDGAEIQLISFEWLLPGFRSIDGSGLRPDVEVAELVAAPGEPRHVKSLQDVAADPTLRAALRLLRDVLGDDLVPSVTVPARTPQLGPTMLPMDDEDDEGDETVPPLREAPPSAPPADEPSPRGDADPDLADPDPADPAEPNGEPEPANGVQQDATPEPNGGAAAAD